MTIAALLLMDKSTKPLLSKCYNNILNFKGSENPDGFFRTHPIDHPITCTLFNSLLRAAANTCMSFCRFVNSRNPQKPQVEWVKQTFSNEIGNMKKQLTTALFLRPWSLFWGPKYPGAMNARNVCDFAVSSLSPHLLLLTDGQGLSFVLLMRF